MTPHSGSSAPQPQRLDDATVANRLKARHILVVENDVGKAISMALLAAGCAAADIAGDGEDGLACLRRQSYDLIVLNYRMPRLDGAEMLRRIRERGDRTPVIFVSATSLDEIAERIDDLAYDDWIEKPFSMRLLVERVAAALIRHGR